MFSLHWLVPRFQVSWIGAAIGAAAGLAGSIIGSDSQDSANQANSAMSARQMEFQKEQNQKAMDFSERMSNTQWTRGVKDMQAAGLNPMLAYSQGPASAPSGVTSSGSMPDIKPRFTPQSFGTAAQMAQFGQQIQQGMATTSNIKADTVNKGANEDVIRAQAEQIRADTRLKILQAGTESYRPGEVINRADREKATAEQIRTLVLPTLDNLRAQAGLSRSSAAQIDSQRFLMKELMSNPWTNKWAPYLLDAFRGGK